MTTHRSARRVVPLAMAASLLALPAAAQPPLVSLAPVDPARWEVAGDVGWLGKTPAGASRSDWVRWYDSASFGGSVGYFATPHLKVELDAATTTEGELYETETFQVPGAAFPSYRIRTHRYRSPSVSGSLAYQFFENRWFHPFAAAGLEVSRERDRIDVLGPGPNPRDPTQALGSPVRTEVSYSGRPFVAGGFKAYMSERAFFRTDLRVAVTRDGARSVWWRAGIGVNF